MNDMMNKHKAIDLFDSPRPKRQSEKKMASYKYLYYNSYQKSHFSFFVINLNAINIFWPRHVSNRNKKIHFIQKTKEMESGGKSH